MAHAQGGDRDAYRALLEDIRPLILGWLRRWLGDDADLADVYQHTLVHLHPARASHAPHAAADHGRLRKRRMREVLVEDVPEVPIDGDQERPALADALSALPRQQ